MTLQLGPTSLSFSSAMSLFSLPFTGTGQLVLRAALGQVAQVSSYLATLLSAGMPAQGTPPVSFQHLPSALMAFQNSTCRFWSHLLLWETCFSLLGFCNVTPLSAPFLPSRPWTCLSFHSLFSPDAIHAALPPLFCTLFYYLLDIFIHWAHRYFKENKNPSLFSLKPLPSPTMFLFLQQYSYDSSRRYISESCYSFSKY